MSLWTPPASEDSGDWVSIPALPFAKQGKVEAVFATLSLQTALVLSVTPAVTVY